MRVTLDWETYSEAELKNCGVWRYAEDSSTEPLCLSYSIDEGEVHLWRPGDPCPWAIVEAADAGAIFDAHNAQFERAIWERVMVPRYGWPEIDPGQWDCTMARAASRALPLNLDSLGGVLGLETRKDKRGKALLQKLSKPRKPTKKNPALRNHEAPLLGELGEYCVQDTRVELLVRRKLGALPAAERRLWLLDQKINARGIAVDVPGIHAALDVVGQIETKLGQEFNGITGLSAGQVAETLKWLHARGCHLDDLTKESVTQGLAAKPGGEIQRVLELRQILSRASTKKLHKLLASVCSDGRVRGTMQYHGAFTGRWAGRLVQPQNLPRPVNEGLDPDMLVRDLLHRDAEFLDGIYGDAMTAVVDSLRNLFIAAPGKKLVSGDLNAIEAVGLAALAGEESKLEVFRKKLDPYCTTASVIFGYPVIDKKTHPKERQVGKIGELAFGYGGGVGAWRNFDHSDDHTDDQVQGYKKAWRDGHPNIVQMWSDLEELAISACNDGRSEGFGFTYAKRGENLVCVLPSGRAICYFDPRLKESVTPWGSPTTILGYMAQKEGQWKRVSTWGGKLAENVTQAACRDVLVEGMFRTEDELAMPIVLTVHDEIVVEVDADRRDCVDELTDCMSVNPSWAQHWPIRSEGWEGSRYRK